MTYIKKMCIRDSYSVEVMTGSLINMEVNLADPLLSQVIYNVKLFRNRLNLVYIVILNIFFYSNIVFYSKY